MPQDALLRIVENNVQFSLTMVKMDAVFVKEASKLC